MIEARPAEGAVRARLEAAIALLAADLAGRPEVVLQADADAQPDGSASLRLTLALRCGPGSGLSLLSPPAPLAEALRAAADGERLHVVCNRGGAERAWVRQGAWAWIAAGRPTPADAERRAWREAGRRLADGQSLLLGAEERGGHARLRQQAMLAQDPFLDRLHRGEAGMGVRIHRTGALVFACFRHPGPAMADSFCALHL